MDNRFLVNTILKNKWVRLALIINAIIIVIIVIIAIDNAQKTATLMINLAPADAKVSLGGQDYMSGAYQIKPGEYSITISRDGLTPKEFTINVEGDSVTNLVTFLSNNGNLDYYTLKGNYGSFYTLSQIAAVDNNITTDQDKTAEEFIAKYQKAYNLYQTALPINFTEYESLEHGRSLATDITIKRTEEDCTKTLCIQVLALTSDGVDGKALANELLTSNGFNLEDYEIKYKTY
ncbi:hypothetical protein IKG10_00205 [Candidatus Saccharibacteria bacterium]|nr:hypothetical protein [Candidatus Saccharibacteria bacterium]